MTPWTAQLTALVALAFLALLLYPIAVGATCDAPRLRLRPE